jgi:hypothetical protein
MSAARNLKYYLDHPDEMPEDPKEIEALTRAHMDSAMESSNEQLTVDRFVEPAEKAESAPAVEEAKEAPAKAVAETPAVEATSAPATAEAKPEGVLAKDGKHVIPYSQLESARARATAAENLAAAKDAEIAALKAEKAAPATPAATEMLTEDELQVLEADSPTLAKTLRAQQDAIRQLTEQVNAVTSVQQNAVAVQETAIKSEVQTAIDSNATLAEWQTAQDQTMWERASALDKTLRAMPEYANVSFADRFKTVVEMTAAALKIELPQEEIDNPAPTKDEVKRAAAAVLAKAQKAKRPTSLSDIPGGAPPAVDERAKVEEASPVALGQQFMQMNREQLDAYLATL